MHLKRLPYSIVITQVLFNIAYIYINSTRYTMQTGTISAGESVSLALPLFLTSLSLNSFLGHCMRSGKRTLGNDKQSQGSSSMVRVYSKTTLKGRMHTALLTVFGMICSTILILCVIIIIRVSITHSECLNFFGNCFWRHARPRYYFAGKSSIFGLPACNQHVVETVDVGTCSSSSFTRSLAGFTSLREVRGFKGFSKIST